jgi:peptidoglycan/xylan/chitin deacetylase (PgdA/CDA1 family)
LDKAQDSNSSLTSKNKSLNSQITSLNSTIITLKNENKALRETIENLGATVPEEGGSDEGDDTITESSTSTSTESTKIAYLTFDDGVSKYTNEILDILARYNVKATFFPNWRPGITDYKEKYKRMVNDGHAIGNHTYSHEYKDVYSTLDGFKSEITRLNDKIEELTGYTPTIFRFPGGSSNTVHKNYNTNIIQPAISALADMGMEYYDWNVDSGDAASSKGASKDTIVKNVLSRATMNKAVILMHDTNTKGTTVAALPEIIEGLMEKGYTFGVLTDGSAPVVQYVKPQN